MPHDHSGHHHHGAGGDRNVAWAFAVNLALSLAQIAGGIMAGSIALIADALHNLSDAGALLIALAARRIARRPADAAMTFGYGRAEVVAALVNYTALIVISLGLGAEAILRMVNPPPVHGWTVIVLAGVALVVNTGTALLTWRMSKDSMNIRAAFLHTLGDAATSAAVILAGAIILIFGWRIVDPLVTLAISGWILWVSGREIVPVIRILMLGAPPDIGAEEVLGRIAAVEGVREVHHLHLWQMDEKTVSVEAHLVVSGDGPAVSARVRADLEACFGIDHATFEVETAADCCRDAPAIGHAAQ